MSGDTVEVENLWGRLEVMESERRFDGRSYPLGMCQFPFRLGGQGFFPGGDGLWRDESTLAHSSSKKLQARGIMFLGNDFGVLGSYAKLQKKGYENPLTWKHVKARVVRAGLPPSRAFFTNAVMGLREQGTALDRKDWAAHPEFRAFCREFLIYQVEQTRPQLIVVLGPVPRATIDCLEVGRKMAAGRFPKMQIGEHTTTLLFSTHPYGDFNFDEDRKERTAVELREAWKEAQSQT
jgi:hypothetical protein